MISKYIVILTTVLFCLSCYSENNINTQIKLDCKLNENSDLLVSISNKTENTVYFWCSADKKIDENWREVMLDISKDKPSKAVKIFRIDAHASTNLIWLKKMYDIFIFSNEEIFRIKATITDKNGQQTGHFFYSDNVLRVPSSCI